MTNAEDIRSMDNADLAEFLCKYFQCDEQHCPATVYCWNAHNGMTDWLNEEAEVETD